MRWGDDIEKGVMLKPGSFFMLPANPTHRVWTTDEEAILQITFTGPGGITFINPADDPQKKPNNQTRQIHNCVVRGIPAIYCLPGESKRPCG